MQNFGGHSNGVKLLEGADAGTQLLPVAAVRRGRTVRLFFPSDSLVMELEQNF